MLGMSTLRFSRFLFLFLLLEKIKSRTKLFIKARKPVHTLLLVPSHNMSIESITVTTVSSTKVTNKWICVIMHAHMNRIHDVIIKGNPTTHAFQQGLPRIREIGGRFWKRKLTLDTNFRDSRRRTRDGR